jgi:hypothetical protein
MELELYRVKTLSFLEAITPRNTPWNTIVSVARAMGTDYYPKYEVQRYASIPEEPERRYKLLVWARLRLILMQNYGVRCGYDTLPQHLNGDYDHDITVIEALRRVEAETAKRNAERRLNQ